MFSRNHTTSLLLTNDCSTLHFVFMSESRHSHQICIFSFFFFFNCVGFYIRLLPWAERLPVFVSGSGVKMAAAPV